MPNRRLNFVVDEERDRDILSWWAKQDNKSAAIRALIRKEIEHDGLTLLDLYQAVLEVERLLVAGVVLAGDDAAGGAVSDEPPDLAAALDRLGL